MNPMPLLEVTKIQKVTATVTLEESTAKQVDQYAAFLKAGADDVINQALIYVFTKDKDFQKFCEGNSDVKAPQALRVKTNGNSAVGAKRGPKPANNAAQ
jgi:hypothetical protein